MPNEAFDKKRLERLKEQSAAEFQKNVKGLQPVLNTLKTARYRYVLLVLIVASLAGVLWFGFKDAGSYYGYTAGSLFRPDRYVETAVTEYFGEWQGLTADEVNRQVSSMRLANLPGVLGCGAVLAATAVFSWWAGLGLMLAQIVVKIVFDMSADTRSFFVQRYRADHPAAPKTLELSSVVLYTWRYVFDPGSDNGVAGTLLDAEMVQGMREALADIKVSGGYLLANGLWVDGNPARLRPALSFISLDPVTVAGASQDVRDAGAVPVAPSSAPAPVQGEGRASEAAQSAAAEKIASGSVPATASAQETTATPSAAPEPVPVAAPAVRRFCAQCGAKLPDDARFCPRCGTPRDTASVPRPSDKHTAAPAKDAGVTPVNAPKDGSQRVTAQPDGGSASGTTGGTATQPDATGSAPVTSRPSHSRAPIVAAVCAGAAVLALLFVIVVLPALGPKQTPETAGTIAVDGEDLPAEALPDGAGEDAERMDEALAREEEQADEDDAQGHVEEPADSGASDLLSLNDPAQIAASLGPASDGATGTYENIPDTQATQLWTTCMPQGPVTGLEYDIALDGSYMRISAQRGQSGASDVMSNVLSELDATPDMFFQDGSGAWHMTDWQGFRICSRAAASADGYDELVIVPLA